MIINEEFSYGLAWLSFGLLHSFLARGHVKACLKPYFGVYYRITYNIIAAFHIGVVYVLGVYLFVDHTAFVREAWLWWCQGVLHGMGWICMFWALREYDLSTLGGLRQIKDHFKGVMSHDEEPLHFNGFHQWVRHPLYAAGFMILWGRVVDTFSLMTAIFGSLYLWVGSVFEERHLIRLYGDDYATYKSRVPAFFPFKGRVDLKDPRP